MLANSKWLWANLKNWYTVFCLLPKDFIRASQIDIIIEGPTANRADDA